MPTKPQDPRPAFGREVRRRRLAERWTIEQLAARAGISPNYLGAIERGIRDPSVSVIEAIAGGLGITAHELLGGDPKPLTPASPRGSTSLPGDARRHQAATAARGYPTGRHAPPLASRYPVDV